MTPYQTRMNPFIKRMAEDMQSGCRYAPAPLIIVKHRKFSSTASAAAHHVAPKTFDTPLPIS